jgi:phospholipid/cholesterol/gamma-HCH transport system substrate-binding protein
MPGARRLPELQSLGGVPAVRISLPRRRRRPDLPSSITRRALLAAVGVIAVGGLVSGLVVATGGSGRTTTLTAEFTETPGLYAGNLVDVLGIPVGRVTRVTPGPASVAVTMVIEPGVRVPAGATAFLMAPNVVNDRYVELDPAYTGGPVLADHAVIANDRTVDPVSVDQIIGTLDQLAVALGPKGANAGGALSQLFHRAAQAFAGDGPQIKNGVSSFGHALGALNSNGRDLSALIDNLGNLTRAASQATGSYEAFAGDLATVSSALAGDSTDIQAALANFAQALDQVKTFVQTDGAALGLSVANLDKVAAAIGTQQNQLTQLLSAAPLALQNLANAYDPHPAGGGGPALRTRYDPVGSSLQFADAVCGSSILRLLLLSIDQAQDKVPGIDLGCGVSAALEALPPPPGASAGPNLSLSHLLGSGG